MKLTRRTVIGGMAGSLALGAGTRAFGQAGKGLPSSPVTLNIVDVAGNLALTQRRSRPIGQESEAGFQGHLHQGAGAGTAGQDQGAAGRRTASISTSCSPASTRSRPASTRSSGSELLPDHAGAAAEARRHLSAGRRARCRASRKARASASCYCPSGPLLEYMPDKVKQRADDGRGTARLGQGQSRTASCMRARPIPVPAAPS